MPPGFCFLVFVSSHDQFRNVPTGLSVVPCIVIYLSTVVISFHLSGFKNTLRFLLLENQNQKALRASPPSSSYQPSLCTPSHETREMPALTVASFPPFLAPSSVATHHKPTPHHQVQKMALAMWPVTHHLAWLLCCIQAVDHCLGHPFPVLPTPVFLLPLFLSALLTHPLLNRY